MQWSSAVLHMEFVLILLFGLFLSVVWISDQFHDVRSAKYDSIWRVVHINPETSSEARNIVSDRVSRERCFSAIDSDMKYILGEDWRAKFDSNESDFIFQHSPSRSIGSSDYQFQDLENIVFYLVCAHFGRSPENFAFHNISGFSSEDAHTIIKRACIVIERKMKETHKDLGHELDMYVCKIGKRDVIKYWYDIDYLHLKDVKRLEV